MNRSQIQDCSNRASIQYYEYDCNFRVSRQALSLPLHPLRPLPATEDQISNGKPVLATT